MKSVDFFVRGDDPSLAELKNLVKGLGIYMNDESLGIVEKMMVTVTTERDDVASMLTKLAKQSNAKIAVANGKSSASEQKPKRKYTRRAKKDKTQEEQPAEQNAEASKEEAPEDAFVRTITNTNGVSSWNS